MHNKNLIMVGVFVFLVLLIWLLKYLDVDSNWIGYLLAVIGIVLGPYMPPFSHTKPDDSTKSTTAQITTKYKSENHYFALPIITFSLLLVVNIIILNLMSVSFQNTANLFGLSKEAYNTLRTVNAGLIFLSSSMPLSAIGSYKIGFRQRPISWSTVLISSVLTFGCITIPTIISGLKTGLFPIENLAKPETSTPYGTILSATLTFVTGISIILFITTYFWGFSKLGHWRFRHLNKDAM